MSGVTVQRSRVESGAPRETPPPKHVANFGGRRVAARTGPQHVAASARAQVAPGKPRSLLTRLVIALRSPFEQPRSAGLQSASRPDVARPRTPTPSGANARAVPAGEPRGLATADAVRLGNYLVNGIGQGTIPHALHDELQTSIRFAGQLDADLERAGELLDKSATKRLDDAERREVSSLVLSNKHNLVSLQTWLANRAAELDQRGESTPASRTLYDALQTRFAERLMDVADLMCRYELDEPDDEPVCRADRASAHLLHADAALRVAENLEVPGLPTAARQRLVEELRVHRDELARIRDVSSGKIEVATGAIKLEARTLWEAPVPLVEPKAAATRDLKELHDRWQGRAGEAGLAPLPTAHPRVGQPVMLREFMVQRLTQAGVSKDQLPDLKAALADAYSKTVNDQPWDPIVKQVRTRFPHGDGSSVTVESRITPGKGLAPHFAEDYASNGINCADRTEYKHVPNLAHTSVANADGKVLFEALRHGVIDAYRIDAKLLARLPDSRVRTMIGDLLIRDDGDPEAGVTRESRIDALLAAIRRDPAEAARCATSMRVQASRNMAAELAVAALASNPEKFGRACAGEVVDLELSSISLLTPDYLRGALGKVASDERTMLRHQSAAFADLGRDGPVELSVRDRQGQPRTVRANVKVRQFNFGVNAGAVEGVGKGPLSVPAHAPGVRHLMGWSLAMERNNPHLTQLLGPVGTPELGGDAEARLRSLSARADELREQHRLVAREVSESDPTHPDAAVQRRRLESLTRELASLDKSMRTLREAGTQLKEVWGKHEYRRGGGDPYKMVSRLALLSHLMGETTLFNCKSGKDRTGQLDAEVKFLATAADERAGALPPVDRDMARWRSARSDFTLHSGNLEMQQLNTGLPGYKLKGVAGLKNLLEEGMKPIYRGGSSYVSS